MREVTMNIQEYESLVALSRKGAELEGVIRSIEQDPSLRTLWVTARERIGTYTGVTANLESFLKGIEVKNGINRYFIAVRWVDADAPVPVRTRGITVKFPEVWPPTLEGSIELMFRPVSKSDVVSFLASRCRNPLSVMVTRDPGKRVGWTLLDDFFV